MFDFIFIHQSNLVFVHHQELAAHRKQGSGILNRVGSTLKTTSSTYLLKNRDPEFTIMQEYIQTFGDKLGAVDRITGRILGEEKGEVKDHSVVSRFYYMPEYFW